MKKIKKHTLITGATGGLGEAFAFSCASRGWNLVLCGTKQEVLDERTEKLKKAFPELSIVSKTCDQSKAEDRKKLFDFLKQKDIILNRAVCNAGFISEGEFLNYDDETVCKIIQVNCEGTVDIAQKAIKQRDKNEKFFLITTASLAGFYVMPQMAIYAASKRFLINFFLALRSELKDQNVNVTVLCPGGIPTTAAMKASIKAQGLGGKLSSKSPEEVAEYGLKKSEKNKAIAIPGFFNRFLKTFSELLPTTLVSSQIKRRWKKVQKKQDKSDN